MNTIYVTGHQNPDVDCTTASYCYAYLKNQISKTTHTAIRCGSVNNQTKLAFQKAGLPLPELKKTIEPIVGTISRNSDFMLKTTTPVYEAINYFTENTISILPVFDSRENIVGTLSLNEINNFFLIQQSSGPRPIYDFNIENIARVVPGHSVQKGKLSSFKAPIMTGAMEENDFESHLEPLKNTPPLLVIGRRKQLIKDILKSNLPCIVFTGMVSHEEAKELIGDYKGAVYVSSIDTAETVRLLRLSAPVSSIMDTDFITTDYHDTFDKTRKLLLNSKKRGLVVLKNDEYNGIVSRRSFITRPQNKLILVDHNELHQSISGAEQAEIVEIIDHHRLGAHKTNIPIYISCKPLGSCSTLVYQHYKNWGVDINLEIAILLMAGILSDTVNLQSPTTTTEDKIALNELSLINSINPNDFAEELFAQLKELKNRNPAEVIAADFKTYDNSGYSIGIGQVEVVSLAGFAEKKTHFHSALETVCKDRNLNWTMLLVTNVLKNESLLVCSDFPNGNSELVYKHYSEDDNYSFHLPGILSRKKQLLPEVFRVLETL